MTWNWQQPDWPNFTWDSGALAPLEQQFLLQSGEFIGVCKHIGPDDQQTLKIELISDEAVRPPKSKAKSSTAKVSNRRCATSSVLGPNGQASRRPSEVFPR